MTGSACANLNPATEETDMPLYDYQCDACGPFRDWGSMAQSDQPTACLSCGAPSLRLLSAPFLSGVSANTRFAHERNERSAEAPRLMQRAELDAHGRPIHHHAHQHGRNMYRPSMLGHAH
jgi:putative FmdB family regulatory protein